MFKMELVKGIMPDIKRKSLVIAGDGRTLIYDLWQLQLTLNQYDIMTIGRSIQKFDRVDHYVDVDCDAGKWVVENLSKNHGDKVKSVTTHTYGPVKWFDCGWELKGNQIPSSDTMWHGSSSLFAAMIAVEMGYEIIFLAGCPLDRDGHWYDLPEQTGPSWQAEDYAAWEAFAKTPAARKVCSLSGFTREVLMKEPMRQLDVAGEVSYDVRRNIS